MINVSIDAERRKSYFTGIDISYGSVFPINDKNPEEGKIEILANNNPIEICKLAWNFDISTSLYSSKWY